MARNKWCMHVHYKKKSLQKVSEWATEWQMYCMYISIHSWMNFIVLAHKSTTQTAQAVKEKWYSRRKNNKGY